MNYNKYLDTKILFSLFVATLIVLLPVSTSVEYSNKVNIPLSGELKNKPELLGSLSSSSTESKEVQVREIAVSNLEGLAVQQEIRVNISHGIKFSTVSPARLLINSTTPKITLRLNKTAAVRTESNMTASEMPSFDLRDVSKDIGTLSMYCTDASTPRGDVAITVQYGSDGDYAAANWLKNELINNGYSNVQLKSDVHYVWKDVTVIVGAQEANPTFEDFVSLGCFRNIVESDNDYAVVQGPKKFVSDSFNTIVYGAASWTGTGTWNSVFKVADVILTGPECQTDCDCPIHDDYFSEVCSKGECIAASATCYSDSECACGECAHPDGAEWGMCVRDEVRNAPNGIACTKDIHCASGYCKNDLCNPDPCEGITCPDKCQDEIRLYSGSCSGGTCYYTGEDCNNYNHCDEWVYYCSGNDVRAKHWCYDYTCSSASCVLDSSGWADDQYLGTCPKACYEGSCVDCDEDSDCKPDGLYCNPETNVIDYQDWFCTANHNCDYDSSNAYDCDDDDGRVCSDATHWEYRDYKCSSEGCIYDVTDSGTCTYACYGAGQCITTATVHGYLKDEDSNPITSTKVMLTDCSDGEVAHDYTDGNGYFSISANAGDYKLKAVMPYDIVTLADCQTMYGDIDAGTLNVPTKVFFSGKLIDEDSSPIAGATVKFTTCNDVDVVSDVTDSKGEFELETIYGDYKLKAIYNSIEYVFENPEGLTCLNYKPGTYANKILPVTTKFSISGVVHNEFGSGIEGVEVKLTDCSDNFVTSQTTGPDGSFTLRALEGGYKLKLVYESQEITLPLEGQECNHYIRGINYNIENPIVFTTKAHLNGVFHDEYGNPLQGIEVMFTDCSTDAVVATDTSGADGSFDLSAEPGSYKFKAVTSFGTLLFILDGEECHSYHKGYTNLAEPVVIEMHTTLHGYLKYPSGSPVVGAVVKLYDCNDNFVTSATSSSSGYFSVTADSGSYSIKIEVGGVVFLLTDGKGHSCFLLMGDIDLGTLELSLDCSVFDEMCYNENWRLFGCYFDEERFGCTCYYEVCQFGCTDGQGYCNPGQTGNIYVDVDNINDNYNPLPGAKVYLDSSYVGSTDSLGKKTVSAYHGYRTVKVNCPDDSYCSEQDLYVDGNEYVYFDCDCPIQKGDIQVNVENPNGYPVANVYVYLDDYEKGLTTSFGYWYIEDVDYGSYRVDIYYKVTNPDHYGIYKKSKTITVDQDKEVVNFVADYNADIKISYDERDDSYFSKLDYNSTIAPIIIAVALGIVDIISVTWSTDDFCRCIYDIEGDIFGGPGGIQGCIESIQSCGGDIRRCTDVIKEKAGPTAGKCWFEEAMLVGDAVSPFIPVGLVGHGAVTVGKYAKKLSVVDNIARYLGKVGDDIFKYGKKVAGNVIEYTAKWWDNLWKFTKHVDIGVDVARFSDEAWEGAELVVRKGGNRAGKRIVKEVGEEAAEKLFKNVDILTKKGIKGADGLADDVAKHAKNLDEAMATGNKALEKGSRNNLKGLIFQADVAANPAYIDEVAELSKKLNGGSLGDIDILLKNGDIIEVKNIDWSVVKPGTSAYNNLWTKSIKKIRNFKSYDPYARITFVFKGSIEPGIEDMLKNIMHVGVEVI